MLRETKMLEGCLVRAMDGPAGRVAGVLLDDEVWAVRYLIVDTGGRLPGERVLMLPDFVEGVNEAMPASIRVGLTRERVWESPPVEADRPVSVRQEADYYAYLAAAPCRGVSRPVSPLYVDPEAGKEEEGDPHLRSAREVRGFAVRSGEDRSVGHVEDLVYDDSDWAVRYLIVDTRDWLPAKKVPVSADWVSGISPSGAQVEVDLTAEEMHTAPGWEPGTIMDRRYETELHAHYGRTPYWVRRQDHSNMRED
ncbi:MAG: hypothetical protein AVDCRST_MAG22-3591 [uncultured Rubrobacteraceae bacterium]|uniref:PRC-barrel domain-containing protein n=1 Tax=uncultured Rubrobacteraceae bacterium TaxID=349277 RepID=A0A6J4Q564_9ACTN|nr:MAG: hypothetical protein AVDCRST_MAG22-3591 [uncultured Rubrobacteraceae bacterium]